MRAQRQSDLEKHGEGRDHERAKNRLVEILEKESWEVHPDMGLSVSCMFEIIKEYYHEFDVYARKKHDNGLTSELLTEIDGRSHERPKQKNRDRTAEEYAAFFLPDCVFRRIDISILLNPNVADANILDLLK